MTITANLADGRVLNFPDGTDPQVIQNTVKSMVSQQPQPSAPISDVSQPMPQPDIPGITGRYQRGELDDNRKAAFEELQRRGEIPTDEGQFGIMSIVEPAATIGSAIVTDPIKGFAAVRTLLETGDVDKATQVIKQVEDLYTYEAKTKAGKAGLESLGKVIRPIVEPVSKGVEALGDIGYKVAGPVGGAAVVTTLAAIPEILGLKGTRAAKKAAISRKIGKQADALYDELGNILPEVERGLDDLGINVDEIRDILPDAPKAEALKTELSQKIGEAAKARTGKERRALEITEEAMPDPEIIKAADELGVAEQLIPSHTAQNPVYIALEQGLKSIPGSQLAAKEKIVISQLGKKADELIQEFGGELDKSLLSDKFRTESRNITEGLEVKASELFEELNTNLPRKFTIKADNILNSLRSKSDDLGGDKYLEPIEQKLLKDLSPKSKPTYARLDNLRKKVGSGLKGKGPFKDADAGALKQLYKNIAKDQLDFAQAQGWGDTYKTANSLVVQRKGIEDQLVKTLGKELAGDISAKGKNAVLGLQKGDTKLFDELSKNIPEELGKDMRKSVFATALNDAFVQGSRAEKSLNVAGFDDFMAGLNRNKAAKKRLSEEIGTKATQRLETMHKVVGGIRKAQKEGIATGRITAVPKMFDEVDNIASRLYGVGKAASLVKGAALGTIETIINAKITPRSVAADDLLSSSKFQDLIKQQASGQLNTAQKSKKANEIANKLKEFKKWKETIPDRDIYDALTVSALGYLTGQTIEGEK